MPEWSKAVGSAAGLLDGLPRCGAGGRAWRGADGPTGLLEDTEWAPQVRCRRACVAWGADGPTAAFSKTLNGPPRCGAGGCAWRGAEGPTTGLLEDVEWAPQVRCRRAGVAWGAEGPTAAFSKTLNGPPRCGAGGCAWRGAEGPTTGLLEDVEWAPQVRCRWVFWPGGCAGVCGGGFQPPSERWPFWPGGCAGVRGWRPGGGLLHVLHALEEAGSST